MKGAFLYSAMMCSAFLSATMLPACRDRRPSVQGSYATTELPAVTRCRGPGEKSMAETAVDIRSDRQNCGGCGRTCALNSTCIDGKCPNYERLASRSLNTCMVLETAPIQCWTKVDDQSPVVVHDISRIGPVREIQGDQMSICALRLDGHLRCWGENWGQRLDEPAQATSPSLPPNLLVRQFSNRFVACVLLSDESVRCAKSPRLGDRLSFGEPLVFASDPPVGVSASFVTCVLLRSGSVVCYGDGVGTDFDSQGRFIDLGGKHALALTSGERHACAIVEGEHLVCWKDSSHRLVAQGRSLWGGASIGAGPVEISLGGVPRLRGMSAGSGHTCVWFEDGRLKCWGDNEYGQLGLGDLVARGTEPGQMGDQLPYVDLGHDAHVVTVSAGPVTTCALLSDGRVKCWGYAYTPANSEGRTVTGDQIPVIPLFR